MFTRRLHCHVLRSLAIGFGLAVCILLLASGVAHAATWTNVTVTTTDGWEYPGMTVESTAGDSVILIVNSQGGRKHMPRAGVQTIVDASGVDVTEWVFGGEEPDRASGPADEQSTPRREPERIRPPVAAPEPDADIAMRARRRSRSVRSALPDRVLMFPSLSVGATATDGDAFAGYQGGGSLGFGLRITAIRNAYIGFDYRRQWLGYDRPYTMDYFGYRTSAHVDELYFVFGAVPRAVRLDRPIPFFEAGVGGVFRSNDGGAIATTFSPVYSPFRDDTVFGLLLAGGVILPLSPASPSVGVQLGANIRMTGDGRSDYGGASGMLFGVTAGLTLLLGDR